MTRDELRKRLMYYPKIGMFFWRETTSNSKGKVGEIAGCLHRPTGYWHIKIDGHCWKAHRLAFLEMTGAIPKEIDHVNGDKADNRWANLRPATRSQNKANVKPPKNNVSGFKGVSLHGGRWRAAIKVNQKWRHLGLFATPELAHQAYLAAAREAFGDFART